MEPDNTFDCNSILDIHQIVQSPTVSGDCSNGQLLGQNVPHLSYPPPFFRPPPRLQFFRPRGPPCVPFQTDFNLHRFGSPYVPPNFSIPPPPVTMENCASAQCENESVIYSNKCDSSWLDEWLKFKSLKKQTQKHSGKTLSISHARVKLKRWASIISELDEKHRGLSHGLQKLSIHEWNQKLAEAEVLKRELADISQHFTRELPALKASLSKRASKRSRQKRKLAEQKKEVYLAQLKQQSLHQQADAWLKDMQLSVERARRDETLKKEADTVLSEVTRRQTEGRRQVALLEALQKLRSARAQAAEARGDMLTSEQQQQSKQSDNVIERLLKMWSRQMEEYAKEEHGLRVMLEESAAKQVDMEIQNVRRILSQWETCLFGEEGAVEPEAVGDLASLLSIRHLWDQYLVPNDCVVPMASTIPVGWVLPTTPSSSEWQKLLKNASDKLGS